MVEFALEPWRFAFMQRALLEVAIIAIACGPIGALLMLRRLAYAGESLGHALVPGVALVTALGVAATWGALAGALAAALAVALLVRRAPGREDLAVALVFSVALAGGVVLLALTAPPQRAVAVLFGDVLAVDRTDLVVGAVAAVGLVVLVAGCWRPFALAAFDREWAQAIRLRADLLDIALLAGTALALVVALRGLGALLGLALLLAPAAALRPWLSRAGPLVALSVPVGFLAGVVGLLLSYHLGAAAGPAIAVALVALVLVSQALRQST